MNPKTDRRLYARLCTDPDVRDRIEAVRSELGISKREMTHRLALRGLQVFELHRKRMDETVRIVANGGGSD